MQIKINNISKTYGLKTKTPFLALKLSKLEIEGNQILGLIGPNGSGKSTLALIIAGLIKQTSGEMLIDKKLIKGKRKDFLELREKIGYCFQFPDLQILKFNVFDEVSLRLNLMKNKNYETITLNLLDELKILDLKQESPFKLSQGQKRKVNFASSIITVPELLILDEPTANLDPISRREVIDIIKSLKTKSNLIIIISHDIDLIWEITNKTILLDKGNLIKYEQTNKLFKNEKVLLEHKIELPKIIKFAKQIGISTKARTIKQLAREINGS